MWHCRADAAARNARRPRCDLEEGLAVPLVPRDNWHLIRNEDTRVLNQRLQAMASDQHKQGPLHVATDGGYGEEVATCGAAYAIDCSGESELEVITTRKVVAGMTHNAYTAELEALLEATFQLEGTQRDYVVAIDNKSVQQQFEGVLTGLVKLPRFQFGQWFEIAWHVHSAGVNRTRDTLWIPSHGKRDGEWKPRVGVEERWRKLNDEADAECSASRELFHNARKRRRDAASQQYDVAVRWAEKAMDRCEAEAKRYVESIPEAQHYLECFAERFEPHEGPDTGQRFRSRELSCVAE